MALTGNVSHEILLQVFYRLPFIDDANHLARCNKGCNGAFEENHLALFKAIIVSSKAIPCQCEGSESATPPSLDSVSGKRIRWRESTKWHRLRYDRVDVLGQFT
jgi:hypothetical protein